MDVVTCHQSKDGTLIVCSPTIAVRERSIRHCPICKTRRRFVGYWEVWYGWTHECCECGARFQDGEYCGKPNKRDWSTKGIIAKLKAEWSEIRNLTKEEEKAAVMAALENT